MESQNSSQKNSSRWSQEEDQLLVDSLGEFNVSGMKVDTGFKNGYLDKLEKILHEKFHNCGKKAKPPIQNRVKYLKKQAMTLNEMVAGNGSGFRWDDVNQKLVCDKGVYNDWCKSHRDAIGLFDKKFPHFNALVEIYATDRATGNDAVAPGEAEDVVDCSQHYMTLDDIDDDMNDSSTIGDKTQAPAGTPSTNSGGSKAK